MYETDKDSGVATVCRRSHESSSDRQTQFAASSRPVVPGGTQHGSGMAYSSQPPASQRQCSRDGKANLEVFRSPGGGNSRHDSKSGATERMATMGEEPEDRRQPLYSQGQAPRVERFAPQGSVSVENVLCLLEYQQYRCALTGRKLTPKTAALDHIVPVRFGGEHLIENAQVLHKDVNRAKGSLTSDEFIAMCCEIVQWSNRPTTRKDS